jgi:hypothetical protein
VPSGEGPFARPGPATPGFSSDGIARCFVGDLDEEGRLYGKWNVREKLSRWCGTIYIFVADYSCIQFPCRFIICVILGTTRCRSYLKGWDGGTCKCKGGCRGGYRGGVLQQMFLVTVVSLVLNAVCKDILPSP